MEPLDTPTYGPKLESLTEVEQIQARVENRVDNIKSYQDVGELFLVGLVIIILGNIIYQSLKTYTEIKDKNRRALLILLRIILCIVLCIIIFSASLLPLILCGMTGQCSDLSFWLILLLPVALYFLVAFIPMGKKTWF